MGKFDFASLGVKMGPPVTPPNQKSWLIYGPPGSGKTVLAASASSVPDLCDVALIDFEAGSISIETSPYVDKEHVTVFRPNNWEESKAVLEALLNEEHNFQTVILDTVGKMMQFMEPEVSRRATTNGKEDGFKKWRLLADDTVHFVELLHRSGMNVIMLAHKDDEKNNITGRINTFPYFLGQKTGKEAPKIFDIIGYLYVDRHPKTGEPLRVLQTEGYDDVVAKDRTDTLPVLFGDPTMERAYEYIKAGKPGKGRN